MFVENGKIQFIYKYMSQIPLPALASVSWFRKWKKKISSMEIIFYRFEWKPTAKEKNLILLDGKLIKKMEAIFKVTEEAFLYWQCETHCWKIWVTINLILAVSFGSSKRSAGKFPHNSPFWLYKLANQMGFSCCEGLKLQWIDFAIFLAIFISV